MSRIPNQLLMLTVSVAACVVFAASCSADPCGMVPPMHIQGPAAVERIGLQKTYVFYKDGIESFVIRPGFRGRVEDFGMLIPFPTPPALRKVPDETFAQIAAAIDPPEVVVDLTPREWEASVMADAAAPTAFNEGAFGRDEQKVVVLKQEAVGMYEVAVLEAGSAAALNQWMTDHGYRYPDGMDDVCNDYVNDGWCFVAVKSRVGNQQGVDPRPGQKTVDASLPAGAQFDGHVQGMGFRFRSDELVVPMRLSAFNEGDMHNVVYLLTDQPMKAEDMPAGHVVRQLEGSQLLNNLTQQLPLRIIGGDYDDIPEAQRRSLKARRDPQPHNGIAKVLFAGDLAAATAGQLTHHHEELEKELLAIGEHLNLRGPELDVMHDQTLDGEREEIADAAIRELEGMTMTVIDGDFDREVVAADNLHFTSFRMNPERNSSVNYNARLFGPGPSGSADVSTAAVATVDPEHGLVILQPVSGPSSRRQWLLATAAAVTAIFLMIWWLVRRRKAALLLLFCFGLASNCVAQSSQNVSSSQQESTDQSVVSGLLDELQNGPDRAAALLPVEQLRSDQVEALAEAARKSDQVERRGWAIVCLGRHPSEGARTALEELSEQSNGHPQLVRCWATAVLIERVESVADLQPYSARCSQLPALKRPLRMKLEVLLSSQKANPEDLLKLTGADPQLQQIVAPFILQTDPKQLARVLLTAAEQTVRQQAAAWLATMKQRGIEGVNSAVIDQLRFQQDAQAVPWQDGPLYVPGINWTKEDATALVSELTAWWVWCEATDRPDEISKIHTNVNSWQLMQAAGYSSVPSTLMQWLEVWQTTIGDEQMQQLMEHTGYEFKPARLEKR